MKHATIIPLIGGMTLANKKITGKDPEVILSYSPFGANDSHINKYLPKGAGAVFTFGLKGGFDAGIKLVKNVNLFSHLANIGDTRSLIIHPASTTHRQLSKQQQISAGAAPDVVRLSVGIETVDDIINDLDKAMYNL